MTHRFQNSDPAGWGVASGHVTIGANASGKFTVREGEGEPVLLAKRYKRQFTVSYTDLAEIESPKATLDFEGDPLPADAVIEGAPVVEITTPFTDGDGGYASAVVLSYDGDSDYDELGTSLALDEPAGVYTVLPPGDAFVFAGRELVVDLDGSVDLDTMTAGEVTFTVFYFRMSEVSDG